MKEFIQNAALSVGFDACGLARAEELTEDAAFLRSWLDAGMHGDMQYMERNFEKRTDPRQLVPGCKTVVVTLLNFNPDEQQPTDAPKIARYAWSEVDYHTVIREKLQLLEKIIRDEYGEQAVAVDYQHSFVDSAPVLERRWAERAGLGWIGKHTQLIAPGWGSWVFIGVLMLQLEVETDEKSLIDRCGTCTRCLDACPTQALTPYQLDARRCISYLTIESKSAIPEELSDKLSGYRVGCDICVEVCPWNKKWAIPHIHPELKPSDEIISWDRSQWDNTPPDELRQTFKRSALKRALTRKRT